MLQGCVINWQSCHVSFSTESLVATVTRLKFWVGVCCYVLKTPSWIDYSMGFVEVWINMYLSGIHSTILGVKSCICFVWWWHVCLVDSVYLHTEHQKWPGKCESWWLKHESRKVIKEMLTWNAFPLLLDVKYVSVVHASFSHKPNLN